MDDLSCDVLRQCRGGFMYIKLTEQMLKNLLSQNYSLKNYSSSNRQAESDFLLAHFIIAIFDQYDTNLFPSLTNVFLL